MTKQYLNLVQNILKNGVRQKTRNGYTIATIGETLRFPLRNHKIPLLTTKKMAWKACLYELLWFIRGETDNRLLLKDNVRIWSPNASREFLDSRGLHHLKEHDLGPIYGHQWRNFNAPYKNCHENYADKGVDQLQNIVDSLKCPYKRSSRRLILSAWNPLQLDEMALPPCHTLAQFHVTNDNELSCSLYQRSGDVGLGIPFNIASYSFLTHILAHHCDLRAKEFIHFIGNAHIYEDHQIALNIQSGRKPKTVAELRIHAKHNNISNYSIEDFKIIDYEPHSAIQMIMRP